MSKRLAAIGMNLDRWLILAMNDLNCFSDFQLGLDLDRFFIFMVMSNFLSNLRLRSYLILPVGDFTSGF